MVQVVTVITGCLDECRFKRAYCLTQTLVSASTAHSSVDDLTLSFNCFAVAVWRDDESASGRNALCGEMDGTTPDVFFNRLGLELVNFVVICKYVCYHLLCELSAFGELVPCRTR